jgi:hypothetical protein
MVEVTTDDLLLEYRRLVRVELPGGAPPWEMETSIAQCPSLEKLEKGIVAMIKVPVPASQSSPLSSPPFPRQHGTTRHGELALSRSSFVSRISS